EHRTASWRLELPIGQEAGRFGWEGVWGVLTIPCTGRERGRCVTAITPTGADSLGLDLEFDCRGGHPTDHRGMSCCPATPASAAAAIGRTRSPSTARTARPSSPP